MVDIEDIVPDDVSNEPVEPTALADDVAPDFDAAEPMICDPVIGFVCPKQAAL